MSNSYAATQASLPGLAGLPYQPPADGFDEMVAPDGTVRPHWRSFLDSFSALTPQEVQGRWDRGQRIIRENGVTYNVYADPEGLDRPWELDPFPFLVAPQEWAEIETALVQRAKLLDAILSDVYGPQTLMKQGLLPPALVYGSRHYLRPMQDVRPPDDIHLHLYAADLARSPDGRWWVVSDRAEAPSGAGYTLETRLIVSRILGDLYRAGQVKRLAPFFMALQDSLTHLSPSRREHPRIVLLTPGPFNETYFEHAYMARYLGILLVEAADLTVRNDYVYLRTMDGLKPVDVILRRTDAAYCDALDLRSDSSLGVAGLVRAIRAGNVGVANMLGSSLIEMPALMAFLPSLCETVLREELAMPSVATWWCGQESERATVLERLDTLTVRPAHAAFTEGIRGDQLGGEERLALAEEIKRKPLAYIGQETVALSTAPSWQAGRLVPKPIVMRVYVLAGPDGYTVMPGGLTRTGLEPGETSISMQQGAGSKDTWVLSEEPVPMTSLLRTPAAQATPVRGVLDLPSRVADNMFWLGRYLERCEDTTRLMRAAVDRCLEGPDPWAMEELSCLMGVLQALKHVDEDVILELDAVHEPAVRTMLAQTLDPERHNGLLNTVRAVYRTASSVRDRLSYDMWRALNQLSELDGWPLLTAEPYKLNLEDVLSAMHGTILRLQALSGLANENMTRGQGWRFFDLGRRFERAKHLCDLLNGALVVENPATLAPSLEVVLEVCDSLMTYRARYLSVPQLLPSLDLLLADESNPRSLGFQIKQMLAHMDILRIDRGMGLFSAEQRVLIGLQARLRTTDLAALHDHDPDHPDRGNLGTLLHDLEDDMDRLYGRLTLAYFAHVTQTRQGPQLRSEVGA